MLIGALKAGSCYIHSVTFALPTRGKKHPSTGLRAVIVTDRRIHPTVLLFLHDEIL